MSDADKRLLVFTLFAVTGIYFYKQFLDTMAKESALTSYAIREKLMAEDG